MFSIDTVTKLTEKCNLKSNKLKPLTAKYRIFNSYYKLITDNNPNALKYNLRDAFCVEFSLFIMINFSKLYTMEP